MTPALINELRELVRNDGDPLREIRDLPVHSTFYLGGKDPHQRSLDEQITEAYEKCSILKQSREQLVLSVSS
jgi:hypothetical protein